MLHPMPGRYTKRPASRSSRYARISEKSRPDLPAGPYTFSVGDGGDFTYQVTINPVPEPSSFAMAALSLLSLGFYRWRRRKCD